MRILSLAETCQKTRLKKLAVYAAIAEGTFPRQVRIGKKGSGWIEHEIDQWIQSRIDDRDSLARVESGDSHDIRQEA